MPTSGWVGSAPNSRDGLGTRRPALPVVAWVEADVDADVLKWELHLGGDIVDVSAAREEAIRRLSVPEQIPGDDRSAPGPARARGIRAYWLRRPGTPMHVLGKLRVDGTSDWSYSELPGAAAQAVPPDTRGFDLLKRARNLAIAAMLESLSAG